MQEETVLGQDMTNTQTIKLYKGRTKPYKPSIYQYTRHGETMPDQERGQVRALYLGGERLIRFNEILYKAHQKI